MASGNWKTKSDLVLNKSSSSNKDVFKDEPGTVKKVQITIAVDLIIKPKVYRPSPVPCTLKDKVESELNCLVDLDIYKPIPASPWAAPIISVIKATAQGRSIQICGDHKQFVSKVPFCNKYPIPKTEDILATFSGGQKFTKLDLLQAFQQLILSPDSRDLLIFDLHKGLFRPIRLQFALHFAFRMFLRELDNRDAHSLFQGSFR